LLTKFSGTRACPEGDGAAPRAMASAAAGHRRRATGP